MSDDKTSPILSTYLSRTPQSRAAMTGAARFLPGGNTRTGTYYPPYPVAYRQGEGNWLEDLDGNRYVDLFFNGLSLIHGNAFPPVIEAIRRAAPTGTAWAGGNKDQFELAQILATRFGEERLVRFTNTGSEAAMLALRLARLQRDKTLVVKFIGAYHGSFPDMDAGLYGQSDIAGRTLALPFNDIAALERCFAVHGDDIAAIIIEPVLFTGRVVPPLPGFLNAVEDLARRHGIVTILDDCLMFRLAEAGSCQYWGLRPDMIVLGKFIGGGTPVGAVIGDPAFMSVMDPGAPGCIYHSGSFNGNVLGMAAGVAALRHFTAEAIAGMGARGERLRRALAAQFRSFGIEAVVSGLESIVGIAFATDTLRHEDAPSHLGLSAHFLLAAYNHGVAIGPGGLMALATSTDDDAIDFAIEGLGKAIEDTAALA